MLEKLTSQADAQLISNGRSIYNKGKDRRGPDERETTILTTKEVLCSNRNVSSKVVHMRWETTETIQSTVSAEEKE